MHKDLKKTYTYFIFRNDFHVRKPGIYQNKKILPLISNFSKDEEYKDNMQNSIVCL